MRRRRRGARARRASRARGSVARGGGVCGFLSARRDCLDGFWIYFESFLELLLDFFGLFFRFFGFFGSKRTTDLGFSTVFGNMFPFTNRVVFQVPGIFEPQLDVLKRLEESLGLVLDSWYLCSVKDG